MDLVGKPFIFNEKWALEALKVVSCNSPYGYSGITSDHNHVWAELGEALCKRRVTEEHCLHKYVLDFKDLKEFITTK